MNMIKKNGGFTLVELIVVIAILAILAGVAVPAYSGYIKRANDAACLSELSAIQTAAQAACALEGETLASITIASDGTINIDDSDADTTAETYGITEFYTAPTNLMTILGKHSNYNASTGVTWSGTADSDGYTGWNLLKPTADED